VKIILQIHTAKIVAGKKMRDLFVVKQPIKISQANLLLIRYFGRSLDEQASWAI